MEIVYFFYKHFLNFVFNLFVIGRMQVFGKFVPFPASATRQISEKCVNLCIGEISITDVGHQIYKYWFCNVKGRSLNL